MTTLLTWLGILFCVSQSALFSGMNLAVFSLSRLRLEAATQSGSREAARVLGLRRDANFTLSTILWGNVSINVLLTLLADSVLAGVSAFLFSTVVITFLGEILPQAYFSRHALRVASLLAPVLRCYQILLWPVARSTGKMLDAWVGPEGISWFRERELREVLRRHAGDATTEISRVEATGAINFLSLDDVPVNQEGELLDDRTIVQLERRDGQWAFPSIASRPDDPFLQKIEASGRKWVVLTDASGEPRSVVNAYAFLRSALFDGENFHPAALCHRPLVVRNAQETLGHVLGQLTVRPERPGDDVVDEDLILVWTEHEKRIITGSDILGRLLRGIATVKDGSGALPSNPLRCPHCGAVHTGTESSSACRECGQPIGPAG